LPTGEGRRLRKEEDRRENGTLSGDGGGYCIREFVIAALPFAPLISLSLSISVFSPPSARISI